MKATIAALLVVGGMTAQAAEPATLTLACKGTVTHMTTEDAKSEPISMGIIVNFTTQTVEGFVPPGARAFPVKIKAANEVAVAFDGPSGSGAPRWGVSGSIDRVTGDVEATSTAWNEKTGKSLSWTAYALKCRPAQRMF